MNPLLLLLIAVLAFAFGYRFYAKLLALGVFDLTDKYSTASPGRTSDRDYVPTNPYFLLGHHVAAVASGATVAGAIVALVWGWVPAFLWVVTGTAVAAGTYGLGSLWLSARRPGVGIFALIVEYAGPLAAYALAALAVFVLLALNALAAGLAAQLLADQPAAVLPFWLLAVLAFGLGSFLHGRRESDLIPASVIALLAALATIWLFNLPVAFTGALNLELSGTPWLALNATTVWVVLLFVYSFYATRAPLWRLSRPRGYLTSLLAAVVLVILFAGMGLDWPTLAASEFHSAERAPGVFPWLFVTLTSGALAGFHLLIAHGVSAKQLRRESQARLVGYGGALADGVLALSALLIAATAFPDAAAWRAQYATWGAAFDVARAATLYLDGFARFAAALGLAPAWARTFGAVVLISLSAATLEAGVRVLKNLLAEIAQTRARVAANPARGERAVVHVATWTGLAVALSDGRGLAGLSAWPLFGSANLLLAGLGLVMLGLALRAARRPVLLAAAPAAFAVVIAAWGLVAQIADWSAQERWAWVAAAGFLLAIELTVLFEAARRWWIAIQTSDGMSAPPGA